MSAAAVAKRRRQSRLFDPSFRSGRAGRTAAAPSPRDGADGTGDAEGLTLGMSLARVWEGLTAAGSVACPLCGAEMRREPGRAEGRCRGCGSTVR